jgi:hypothetical protein
MFYLLSSKDTYLSMDTLKEISFFLLLKNLDFNLYSISTLENTEPAKAFKHSIDYSTSQFPASEKSSAQAHILGMIEAW